ncbi:phosphoenolpyruvate mutase [Paenibacillus sp. IHBB 10380]|uniref:phosphoenolpyruvate mutase n=1 Tax=Paenibacillus sp. IHBB 10380 TaxID=1566358 RepID=UPI0005CFE680|nr:phosphoenolpyruvate mutase [Paenibacillus sp. IHBB 10380]AJS60368.1 phosphoenolpyruvate phosphomutase [Paenibacillus sp. IHBB 10380]
MKKTTQLKNMINSKSLEFIMEAHNGLSAKIVEETGFKGIWGSGLSISASLGVRDNNEASWTQIMEVLEFMSDATKIPILLDGDTGYGNFNNMRRLVHKLEQRSVAGVCIEDKLFPKTNSFISGETQPLADVDEFCGKIKAAKDAQADDDFVVVARVEAFIAGWDLAEALRRADAYRLAGADAVLIHSKKSNPSDIEAFMKEWDNRHPVVIVPTKYYSTPTDYFREMGVDMVIWANHNIRAAVTAMEKTSKQIFHEQSLISIEGKVASVSDIFRLQGADELKLAEKKYLPTTDKKISAIILAASQGKALGELTRDIPKALLKINGKALLSLQVETLNQIGIKDISVVRGFAKEKIFASNIKTVDNDFYESTSELYSLYLAKDELKEDKVISYGDILYKGYILNELLNDPNDITIIADADTELTVDYRDHVKTNKPYTKMLFLESVSLESMSSSLSLPEINGEFIGLWKVSKLGAQIVKDTLEILAKREDFKKLRMNDLFNEIISRNHKVAVKYIKGSWLDVDDILDLQKAGDLYADKY